MERTQGRKKICLPTQTNITDIKETSSERHEKLDNENGRRKEERKGGKRREKVRDGKF